MHSVMGCLFFLYTCTGVGIFKLTSRSFSRSRRPADRVGNQGL